MVCLRFCVHAHNFQCSNELLWYFMGKLWFIVNKKGWIFMVIFYGRWFLLHVYFFCTFYSQNEKVFYVDFCFFNFCMYSWVMWSSMVFYVFCYENLYDLCYINHLESVHVELFWWWRKESRRNIDMVVAFHNNNSKNYNYVVLS